MSVSLSRESRESRHCESRLSRGPFLGSLVISLVSSLASLVISRVSSSREALSSLDRRGSLYLDVPRESRCRCFVSSTSLLSSVSLVSLVNLMSLVICHLVCLVDPVLSSRESVVSLDLVCS